MAKPRAIQRTRLARTSAPRSGVTYLAVTGAATIVAMIALTASHLGRIALNEGTAARNQLVARTLAVSAMECGLARIKTDFNWRTSLTNGTRVSAPLSGAGGTGAFVVTDTIDGDLANDPSQPVRVDGYGRSGSASARFTVELAQRPDPESVVGPVVARAYTASNGSSSTFDVTQSQSIGQYMLPQLPAEAVSWTPLGVDLYLEQKAPIEGELTVRLHCATVELKPCEVLLSVNVPETGLPSEGAPDWVSVDFPGEIWLDPTEGICITLERLSAAAEVAIAHYDGAGVAEPDTHLLTGAEGEWLTTESDKSLRFRVRGSYTTAATSMGEIEVQPGSWQEESN